MYLFESTVVACWMLKRALKGKWMHDHESIVACYLRWHPGLQRHRQDYRMLHLCAWHLFYLHVVVFFKQKGQSYALSSKLLDYFIYTIYVLLYVGLKIMVNSYRLSLSHLFAQVSKEIKVLPILNPLQERYLHFTNIKFLADCHTTMWNYFACVTGSDVL